MKLPPLGSLLLLGGVLSFLPGPLPVGATGPVARAGESSGLGPRFKLKATFPGTDRTGITTDPVAVKFSRPVDLSTVTSASFLVKRGATTLAGTFAHGTTRRGTTDPRILVWTPTTPLTPGADIFIRIGLGVASDLGRPLQDSLELSFTMDPAKSPAVPTPLPDRVKFIRAPRPGPPPKVKWTDPLAGFGSVFTDRVRIRFNRPMDGGSISPSSVKIMTGKAAVPGVLTYPSSGDPREVEFIPESPLFPNTSYSMIVTREARTDRGANLREEYRAGFSTSPFKEGVRPVKPEDFTPGPNLILGRAFHTASALDTGDVVVAGGEGVPGVPTAICELYGRSTGTFTRVGDLATARRKHAGVTLRSGKVFVCGGFGPTGQTLSTVELFDPATGVWTPGASMQASRAHHTATLLKDGRVLVAGGFSNDGGIFDYDGTAEVYQPNSDTWVSAGLLFWRRGGHTATLLNDGKVLLAGGGRSQQNIAELYDPILNACRETLGKPAEHRIFHAAAVVRLGSVLLAGGGPAQAERYDPDNETFFPSGTSPPIGLPVSESPWYPSLTSIPGGRSALLGGLSLGGGAGGSDLVLAQIQLWDTRGGSGKGAFFPMVFFMDVPRAAHTVTSLGDGRYLIVGGLGTETSLNEKRCTVLFPSN